MAPSVSWTEANVVREVVVDPEAEITGESDNSEASEGRSSRGGGMGAMAAFGRTRNKKSGEEDISIDGLEDGFTGSELIVLFVYCDSTETKHRRSTAATEKFQAEVLGNYDVATALQGCNTLKINAVELDRDVRKVYKLSTQCPQLVLMDMNGKKLYRATASTNPETLAKMIEAAKERVQNQVSAR